MSLFIKAILIIFLPSGAFAEGFTFPEKSKWNNANHPRIFFDSFSARFSPSGRNFLSEDLLPWSDDYWPRSNGGIAFRWLTKERIYLSDLASLDPFKLSRKEIKRLSPAEKFDILNGDYNFPFTKKVLGQNPSHAPDWQGICDGWAEASIHYGPASAKTLVNKEDIQIDFGASDIHALLSFYHAKIKPGKAKLLGKRCYRRFGWNWNCEGMNPGAFHVALVESIKREQSFVVDIDPGAEVWNHPVAGYEYASLGQRPPSSQSASQTVKEVRIKMRLSYVAQRLPSWGRSKTVLRALTLNYWLELDRANNIIGGSWAEEYGGKKVDFAWQRDRERLPAEFKRFLK